ncbi:MAG: hypothetical protein ACEQSR_01275 [Candidatus Methylacidiphilales bacterium]
MFEFLKNKNKPSGYAGLDRFKKLLVDVIPVLRSDQLPNIPIEKIPKLSNDKLPDKLQLQLKERKAIIKCLFRPSTVSYPIFNGSFSCNILYNTFENDVLIFFEQFPSNTFRFTVNTDYAYVIQYSFVKVNSYKYVFAPGFTSDPIAKIFVAGGGFFFHFEDGSGNIVQPPRDFIVEFNEVRPV